MRFADPKECKEALQSLSTNSFGFARNEPNAAESAGSHPSSQVNLDGTDNDVAATPMSVTVTTV